MSYATEVLTDAPQVWYWLDEATGATSLLDHSGQSGSRNGFFGGTIATVASILDVGGYARTRDFSGSSQYCGAFSSAPWLSSSVITNQLALEAWVIADTLTSVRAICGRGTNFANFGMEISTAGKVVSRITTATGGAGSMTSTTTLVVGRKYHLVWVYDGTTLKLYINGNLDATTLAKTGNVTLGSGNFTIGAYPSGNSGFFDGRIGFVGVYNTAPSAARVSARFAEGWQASAATATASAVGPVVVGTQIPVPAATAVASTPSVTTPGATLVATLTPATATATAPAVSFAQDQVVNVPAATASGSAPSPKVGNKDSTVTITAATASATGQPTTVSGGVDATVVAEPATAVANTTETTVVVPGGSSSALKHRWTFRDPDTDESWEFPINPNKMASPHSPRSLHIFVNPPFYNPTIEARGGMARVFEGNKDPYEWNFSGYIRTEQHYRDLLYWSRKVNKIHLTDHLDRTWEVRMVEFSPDEKRPTFHRIWRMDYQIKAINYGAVA